jgi:hypothetical protein
MIFIWIIGTFQANNHVRRDPSMVADARLAVTADNKVR